MNLWDIINPWGALRRERHARLDIAPKLACMYSDLATHRKLIAKQIVQIDRANENAAYNLEQALRNSDDATRLNRLVATGHFRNPATGRLGKRGETFE